MTDARAVVTGVGVICAAGRNAAEFFDRLATGGTAIGEASAPGSFDGYAVGAVPDEWLREGVTEAEWRHYGRDALLALAAARESLANAGLATGWPGRKLAGLVLGKCQAVTRGTDEPSGWIHWTADALASTLGVAGPRHTVSTACAAGSNAVGMALDLILAGEADVVLAGGVDTLQSGTFKGFQALQSLDKRPCSPYSRSGGLNLGEGAAFLVVENLAHAAGRGVRPLAEVLGYGLSADAYHATAPDPTGRGAALAVLRAMSDAGIAPAQVSYVSGHGTGTKANDAAERRVMRNVFSERVHAVPITSTKSFVGHTLGAAGAIEAVAAVLSIVHGTIPPTVNFEVPRDGDLDFVPNVARPAPVGVVVSNSYAFGGNNVSIILARPGSGGTRPPAPAAREPLITGIGLLGRLGIGLPEWASWLSGPDRQIPGPDADRQLKRRLANQAFTTPSAWRQMNGFTRLCMAATRLAVEDAKLPLTRERREGIGLFLGSMSGPAELAAYFDFAGRPPDRPPLVHEFTQVTLNAPAGVVCRALGIRGPSTTIISGGASGTLALNAALDAIRLGRADTVIVVAAEEACPLIDEMYESIAVYSQAAISRPYDPALPGTASASGAVAIVLEERSVAEGRGASSYGRILSTAHVNDNYHGYRFDKNGGRYAAALKSALSRCGLAPASIGVVAGSATGTDLDIAESAAFTETFPDSTRVLAAKALTGECESASGLLNVIIPVVPELGTAVSWPVFQVGELGREAARWPLGLIDQAVATSVSFGATFGAVVVERHIQ